MSGPKLRDRVGVLWCGGVRQGCGGARHHGANGWVFPPAVRRHLIRETQGKSVLHLFGGRATFGTRIDIDPIVRPDVIADAWLPPFREQSFDVVILDPPYISLTAAAKQALFRAAGYIARERVIWFSTEWHGATGGLRAEKGWLVRVGDSCAVRCLQFFTVAERPGPVKYFKAGPAVRYNGWLAGQQPLALTADNGIL
jgi:hypothetical protein